MADIFKGHDVNAGVIYQDANVKVTAVENTHFKFAPGTPPYGKYNRFPIASTRRTVLPVHRRHRLVRCGGRLAKGADVLVTEVTSVDDVVELSRNAMAPGRPRQPGAGRLHPPHARRARVAGGGRQDGGQGRRQDDRHDALRALAESDDDYQRFADEAKKHFSGEIKVAKDLMQF